jgi:hypothetical protein
MKDAYLETIRAAGFENVRIVEEFSFPLDCMANDPTTQAIGNTINVTRDELGDLADSVLSIKVAGKKP